MFQDKCKIRCLTLIELVVTVSISVLLLAVSVPLFTQEKGVDRVRGEARLVASFLDKARNLAVHPENEKATAYRIKMLEGSFKVIKIFRLENLNEQTAEIESLYLEGYVIKDMLASGIDFQVFSGEYRGSGVRFTVKDESGRGYSSLIEIKEPGVINVLQ